MAEVVLDDSDLNAFALVDSDWIRLVSYDSDDSDNAVLLFNIISIVDSDKVFIDSDWIRLVSYDSDDSDNAGLLLKNFTINTLNTLITVDSENVSSFNTSTVTSRQVAYGAPAVQENWS